MKGPAVDDYFTRASFQDPENNKQWRTAYRITCGSCPATHLLVCGNNDRRIPADPVLQRAIAAGWVPSDKPKHVKCPQCAAKARSRKTAVNQCGREIEPEQAMQKAVPLKVVNNHPTPAPSRAMEREDRRRIISKLDDAYLDATHGYAPGYSDRKIADELQVIVDWVVQLREENFGPLADVVAVQDLAKTLADMRVQVTVICKNIDDAIEKQMELAEQEKAKLVDMAKSFEAKLKIVCEKVGIKG